jgi:hypothetical protein
MKLTFTEVLFVGFLVFGCLWLHESNECKSQGGILVNWNCVAIVK